MLLLSVISIVLCTICILILYKSKLISFYCFGFFNIISVIIGSLVWDDIYEVEGSTATIVFIASLLAYVVGPLVFRIFYPQRKYEKEKNAQLSANLSLSRDLRSKISIWVCVLISFVVLGIHFYRSGIAIFAENVNYAKVDSFAGGGFILIRFLRFMLPILVIQYIVKLFKENKKGWSPALIILVLICAALSFATGFKGYFVYYFCIPLIIVYAQFGKIKVKHLLTTSLVMLSVLVCYAAFVENTDLAGGLNFILLRLTLSNSEGIYYLINILTPDNGGYFLGKTFTWDIASFFTKLGLYNFEGENLAAYAFTVMKNGDNPLHMQVNTSIIGEMYANFGPYAAVVFVGLYGAFVDWLTHFSEKFKNDFFIYPFILLAGIHAGNLFVTGPILYNTLDLIVSLGMMGTIYLIVYAYVAILTVLLRIPMQSATGFRLKVPPDSDSFPHPLGA